MYYIIKPTSHLTKHNNVNFKSHSIETTFHLTKHNYVTFKSYNRISKKGKRAREEKIIFLPRSYY